MAKNLGKAPGKTILHWCNSHSKVTKKFSKGKQVHVGTNTKHSWQNGTRCRDGVNVLWRRSHLVWLVFEGSIPTCTCFHLENFFVTCSWWIFWEFFVERREVGKEKMHTL